MAEMNNFISIMSLTFNWTMLIKKYIQKLIFSNLLKIKKWNLAAISTASKDFLSTQFSLNLWKNSLYIITKTHLGNQELKNERHSIPFREDIFVCNHICAYLHKCIFVFPENIFFFIDKMHGNNIVKTCTFFGCTHNIQTQPKHIQIHYWQSPSQKFPNHHKRMRGRTFCNYRAIFSKN